MDLKNCFPIYETFKTKADAFPKLTIEQKKQTILDIKSLDKQGKETLYMIIRHSAFLDKDEKVYGAKFAKKGVTFDLDSFSDDLQKIIHLFTTKHLSLISESQVPVEIVFS